MDDRSYTAIFASAKHFNASRRSRIERKNTKKFEPSGCIDLKDAKGEAANDNVGPVQEIILDNIKLPE